MSGEAAGGNLDNRGLPAGYNFRPDWELTPREVARRLGQLEGHAANETEVAPDANHLLLIDCRTEEERKVACIEDSLHVPLHELDHHFDEIEELAADHDIVVHCHLGVRSFQMAALLRSRGVANVKSMAGGIDIWSLDVDPSIARY